jgi:AcrR family transcriptional regulator
MKKLINAVDDVLRESLSGFCAAHADIVVRFHRPRRPSPDGHLGARVVLRPTLPHPDLEPVLGEFRRQKGQRESARKAGQELGVGVELVVKSPIHTIKTNLRETEAILEAATEAFLSNGYAGTSMDEIAQAASVSKQTVYKHFADKKRLFSEIVTSMVDEVSDPVHELVKSIKDSGDIEPDLRFGTGLDNQRAVTVKSTFLQNRQYLDFYYREAFTVVEMEAGPYCNAVYEIADADRYPVNEAVNFSKLPIDLGIIHYASDTPYTQARTLGARGLSYYGMDSTYASSLAILRRILRLEGVLGEAGGDGAR